MRSNAGREKTDEPGADRANKGAGHDLRLSSPNIRETPPNQRAEDRADPAAVKDQRRLAVGQVPLGPDRRQDEGDQKEVEEIENRDQRQQGEADPIAAIERRAVIKRQQVFGGLRRHAPSPTVRPWPAWRAGRQNFQPTENDLDHRVKWSPRAIDPLMIAGVGPPQVRPERIEPHGRSLFDRMRHRLRAARDAVCRDYGGDRRFG
jgi:hypothetical protein